MYPKALCVCMFVRMWGLTDYKYVFHSFLDQLLARIFQGTPVGEDRAQVHRDCGHAGFYFSFTDHLFNAQTLLKIMFI